MWLCVEVYVGLVKSCRCYWLINLCMFQMDVAAETIMHEAYPLLPWRYLKMTAITSCVQISLVNPNDLVACDVSSHASVFLF